MAKIISAEMTSEQATEIIEFFKKFDCLRSENADVRTTGDFADLLNFSEPNVIVEGHDDLGNPIYRVRGTTFNREKYNSTMSTFFKFVDNLKIQEK